LLGREPKDSYLSVAGEPFNALLARIGFQANADIVVFGGLGYDF
jgi:V/A-type H+-transporting ATPase subunit B